MTTFEQIQERHGILEKAAANEPASVRTGQITKLVTQIQETAVSLADDTQRQTLANILAHWATVAAQRGEDPIATTLAPYQPPAAMQTEMAPLPEPEVVPPPVPAQAPTQATTTPPGRPRINWSNPPEWMLRGLTLLIIAALAIGGYYILAYYFDTSPETADLTPTLEPTLEPAVGVAEEETAVVVALPTPTAVLIEVITVGDAPPTDDVGAATAAPQRTHIVGAGDTLSTIATRYGVTIDEIIAANTLLNPNQLEVGQSLVVPFPGQVAQPTLPPAATVVPTAPPAMVPELVVRGADITAVIPLYLEPSTASQPVATLSSGTFATAIGLSEDRDWYLIELADGVTRGWIVVNSAELLYPATPDDLPLLRVVNP